MRHDLLDAQASAEWAWGQLPHLAKRLGAWLDRSATIELRDPGGEATHNLIIGVVKEPLPLSFNAEVGAYINAIRSSLDILAMALKRRHNLNIREEEVYFPIVRKETTFADKNWRGRKFLDALPEKERKAIESLAPYQGGNPAIWTLHHLDIVRKHRRLLSVVLWPISISIKGTLAPGDFEQSAVEDIHVNEEMIIGRFRKGVDTKLVPSKFYVALNEEIYIGQPVAAVLTRLAGTASGIIDLFDY